MNWFSLVLEIFTAVAAVALWLARRDDRPRINGVFMWSTATKYQPTLSAIKIHRKTEQEHSLYLLKYNTIQIKSFLYK